MRRNRPCSLLLFGALAVYVLRRWGQRWGATDAEAHQPLPADDIVPHPLLQTTHAVTIRASSDHVWPWVMNMGYYRGGWYADTAWWDYWADRYLRFLVREEAKQSGYRHRDAPSANRIMPEYQHLKVGDIILDGPPGTAYFTVAALEPNRLLALHSTTHLRYVFPKTIRDNPKLGIGGEFSWVFILKETKDHHTRLILRTRGNIQPWLYRLFVDALLPLADGVYSRKVLTGIKQRAEQASP